VPPAAPSETDLRRLVARLSLEQKVRLLTGADFWSLHSEPSIGLRRVVVSDGPAGVRGELWDERSPAANVPSPVALAAAWDPERVERLGRLLAAECRRAGVHVLLAPTVNLQRTPRGGRNFEFFGEEPLLAAEAATAFVRGVQSQGVAATAKHFVANDTETSRMTLDARIDERVLREVYLVPFEAVVTEAGVWAVMAAYNAVNGATMTESPMLRAILHEEWGFDGVTMSDWFAARSTDATATAGLDLVMPGPGGPWREALVAAVRGGSVAEGVIDDKVLRLLRLAGRVGALPASPAAAGTAEAVAEGCVASAGSTRTPPAVSRELRSAAAAGFVLVRNEVPPDGGSAALLPLCAGQIGSLAVIGPHAERPRTLGGGSATVFPPYVISPVAGLRAQLGPAAEVHTLPGVRADARLATADASALYPPERREPGVEVRFLGADGRLLGSEVRQSAAFTWLGRTSGGLPTADIAVVELRCVLTPAAGGPGTIGASGVGRFTLELDDRLVFDEVLELPAGADPVEGLMAPPQHGHPVQLVPGRAARILLRYTPRPHTTGNVNGLLAFRLLLDHPSPDPDQDIRAAAALAQTCDAAVVVVGTTEEVESEGFDRPSLALPGRQDELVRQVAAANPRTVVVVNAGAPVLLPWRESVAAVLLAWFPGQEFGHALADVLLGTVEPGGRLPVTWPASPDDPLPATAPEDGVVDYAEGLHIGYRHHLRSGVEPAYWFGHGLGYTDWDYGAVEVEVAAGGGADVTVRLRNVGARHGRHVVQVYLSRPDSTVDRPRRWLAGFTAAEADPDEEVLVRVHLATRRFAHWDVDRHAWVTESGSYGVHVGSSVADIARTASVPVTEAGPGRKPGEQGNR
jgi:beta-glucosidase